MSVDAQASIDALTCFDQTEIIWYKFELSAFNSFNSSNLIQCCAQYSMEITHSFFSRCSLSSWPSAEIRTCVSEGCWKDK